MGRALREIDAGDVARLIVTNHDDCVTVILPTYVQWILTIVQQLSIKCFPFDVNA